MIRKYGIGLLALIIAAASVAFTRPVKPTVDMYVFQFDGTNAYSVANVSNTSNTYWKYIGKNVALCNNVNKKACKVEVTSTFVDNPTSPTALSGVTITAALSGTIAYVSSISGTGSVLSNQNQ